MSIATEIQALQADKTAIASAITNKGGTVSSGDGFDDFATDIGTIPAAKTEQSKTMTLGANTPSIVSPDSGYALSSVSPSIDTSVIKAENIAAGTTILGIAGTHSGGSEPAYTIRLRNYVSDTVTIDAVGVLEEVAPFDTYTFADTMTLSDFFSGSVVVSWSSSYAEITYYLNSSVLDIIVTN